MHFRRHFLLPADSGSTGDRIAYWQNNETGTGYNLHDSRIGKSQILIKFKEGTFESGITLPDPRVPVFYRGPPDNQLFIFARNVGVMEKQCATNVHLPRRTRER